MTPRTHLHPRRAVAVLLFALSACDASQPANGSPLVGSWQEQEQIQTLRFTTSQTQQIVDARRPGEGEIAAVGSAAGVHRFAFASLDREDNIVYTVFSTDARPLPADYSFLSLTPYQTTLTVWRSGTVRQFGLSHPLAEAPYSRTGDRLSVSPATLVGPDGATVTVSGSLVLPMLALEAGTEQDVERNASADTEQQITFEADGTYRERDGGQAFVGRWVK